MRAMILCAGLGTRLQPITNSIPKPMIPVAGKPLVEHQIRWFAKHGINEIAINLHHLPDVITNYFRDGSKFGVKLLYSHEPTLLGTAGGVKQVEKFFDGTFVVFYGDNYTDFDLKEMIAYHKKHKAVATIMMRKRPRKAKVSSIIELDASGQVTKFIEKPDPALAESQPPEILSNNGIYVLEPEVLAFIPPGKFYDFGANVFPDLLKHNKKVMGYVSDVFWCELGTLEKYESAKHEIEKRLVHKA